MNDPPTPKQKEKRTLYVISIGQGKRAIMGTGLY